MTDLLPYGEHTKETVLQLAASAEDGSEHPLGEAIVAAAKQQKLTFSSVSHFQAVPGHGITGRLDGKDVLLGNKKLMDQKQIDVSSVIASAEGLAKQGKTPMYVAMDGALIGLIAVADTVKTSSAQAIERLHQMGIKVAMITGDNARTAQAIADQVGIDEVISDVLPEDKAAKVAELQQTGQKLPW